MPCSSQVRRRVSRLIIIPSGCARRQQTASSSTDPARSRSPWRGASARPQGYPHCPWHPAHRGTPRDCRPRHRTRAGPAQGSLQCSPAPGRRYHDNAPQAWPVAPPSPRIEHARDALGRRLADGVAKAHLVAAHREKRARATSATFSGGVGWAVIRAFDDAGDVAAHGHAIGFRGRQPPARSAEALGNGAVDVLLAEAFGGGREDRDLIRLRGARALIALEIGCQHRVADAGLRVMPAITSAASGHLRHPFR